MSWKRSQYNSIPDNNQEEEEELLIGESVQSPKVLDVNDKLQHMSFDEAKQQSIKKTSSSLYFNGKMFSASFWCRKRLVKYAVIAASFSLLLMSISFYERNFNAAQSGVHSGDSYGSNSNSNTITSTTTTTNKASLSSASEQEERRKIIMMQKQATITAQTGAVASDHKVCSIIGTELLEAGGNAVDAAVGTALCLGVVNPVSSGMGGGAFILIHMATNTTSNSTNTTLPVQHQTEFIDCRETAPSAATYDMFNDLPPEASTDGGLAIATPGELKGLELAHRRHGVLPWANVVEPAAKLAEQGVAVSDHLGDAIKRNSKKIRQNDELNRVLSKDGKGKVLLEAGDIFKQPTLGVTLRSIMKDGADALYTGELGKQLIDDISASGGLVSMDDLMNYTATIRDPIIAYNVGGYDIIGAPPPSSGGAALIGILRFLLGYETPYASFYHTLSQHRLVEAMKHAFAIRMSLSDPGWNTDVVDSAVDDLIRSDYIDYLRNITSDQNVLPLSMYGGKWSLLHNINASTDRSNDYSSENSGKRKGLRRRTLRGFQYLEDSGTAHLSIIDKHRNAVSLTSTINNEFGSGILSSSTGILLNNEMDDFASPGRSNAYGLAPSEANYIAGGKRPLSSMSPTIVFHSEGENNINADGIPNGLGRLYMALGASGGPRIISATLQVLLNHAINGMPLYEAIASSRVHDQLLYQGLPLTVYDFDRLIQGGTIELSTQTKKALTNRGHKLYPLDYMGTVQAVVLNLEDNSLTASSDVRKGGQPCGY